MKMDPFVSLPLETPFSVKLQRQLQLKFLSNYWTLGAFRETLSIKDSREALGKLRFLHCAAEMQAHCEQLQLQIMQGAT